jgi:hypothetical protein
MEVLNVIPKDSAVGIGIFLGMIALLGLLAAITGICMEDGEAFVSGTGLVILFGILSILAFATTPERLEVKITDFNEVYEKGYEIVEQRGAIYVIQKAEEN